MTKKYSKGRQKIEIKKIENKNYLNVTFSKRRVGLFRKASELSVLCGAEVAVLVNSPAGRLYSFGTTSSDAIIDRFLTGNPNSFTDSSLGVQQNKYFEALGQLEAQLEQQKSVQEESISWWDQPIDNLGLDELQHYITSLEVLKNNVMNQADHQKVMEMAMVMASASPANVMKQEYERPRAIASPSPLNFLNQEDERPRPMASHSPANFLNQGDERLRAMAMAMAMVSPSPLNFLNQEDERPRAIASPSPANFLNQEDERPRAIASPSPLNFLNQEDERPRAIASPSPLNFLNQEDERPRAMAMAMASPSPLNFLNQQDERPRTMAMAMASPSPSNFWDPFEYSDFGYIGTGFSY